MIHVYEAAIKSYSVDRRRDPRSKIVDVVKNFGGKVILTEKNMKLEQIEYLKFLRKL